MSTQSSNAGRCPCNGRTCAACTPKILETLRREGYPPVHVDKLTRGWR